MATALAAAATLAVGAPAAHADHSMETIVQDDAVFLHRSDAQVDSSIAELAQMGVDRVRLTAGWSVIAPAADSAARPGFDAGDPNAYPPHAWDNLDRAVRDATAHGLKVDIDIAFWAPLWATTDTGPSRARRYIDAADYAQFAQAVARRYSGSFLPTDVSDAPSTPPSLDATLLGGLAEVLGQQHKLRQLASPTPQVALPHVDMYTIWNEPNYGGFLEPQWVRSTGRWHPESPQIYRQLVYLSYPAIKTVDPGATVLVGGTASAGDGPRSDAVPPLRFIRELACVDDRLRPLSTPDCQNFKSIPGDGWAHHPYSLKKPPGQPSQKTDYATISELPQLTSLLGRLVNLGRLSPALRDVWLTEFGYDTSRWLAWKHLSDADQARYLAWSEYLAWSTPHVRSFAQFMLQDLQGSWHSGLYREDGRPKLAAQTFPATLWAQYPLIPRRRARSAQQPAIVVWVHLRFARAPTPVRIERLGPRGSWQPIAGRVALGEPAGAAAIEPTTDPHGYLLLRIPAGASQVLRLDWQTANGWQQGPPMAAQAVPTL
jgi:hypothetical protein